MNYNEGSIILPSYSEGVYFSDGYRHREDAEFKAMCLLKVLDRFLKEHRIALKSVIDVGCGSGDIIKVIAKSLRERGFPLSTVKGYDVSPHIKNITNDGIEYVLGDFCSGNDTAEMVTLFDVFEHVPDPIGFISRISERCDFMGFYAPLDYSINVALRNLFHAKLTNPGHLMFLDVVSALNLLAFSGLRVVDYEYAFGFFAPSGRKTVLQKCAFPIRYLFAKISPWLLSRTVGGASLVVIAITPKGLKRLTGKQTVRELGGEDLPQCEKTT